MLPSFSYFFGSELRAVRVRQSEPELPAEKRERTCYAQTRPGKFGRPATRDDAPSRPFTFEPIGARNTSKGSAISSFRSRTFGHFNVFNS
jgi:hypothetical protein